MTAVRTAAEALLGAGVLILCPDEPITFASGIRSPVYMDIRRLIGDPSAWRTVVEGLGESLRESGGAPEVVAGVAAGGIPHSSTVAYAAGLPSCFVRKEAKRHGRGRAVEGADVRGRRVVLVEDVVTTGGSSLDAVRALREAGGEVTVCLAVAGYGFAETFSAFGEVGVELLLLVPFSELLETASERGDVSPQVVAEARRWWSDPRRWEPEF